MSNKKAAGRTKARVLESLAVGGQWLQPNQVIECSAETLAYLGSAVDADEKAVAYCIDELNATVVVIDD